MSIRRHIRPVVDRAAQAAGFLRRCERQMRTGLTILMYHRVLPDEQCERYPLPSLVMSASAFRSQVQWLAAHCRVLPIGEALDQRGTGKASGPARVAISFDDGYEDNHRWARPILNEAGLRATFFLTTGLIGTDDMLWFDRAALAAQQQTFATLKQQAREAVSTAVPELQTTADWMAWLKNLPPGDRRRVLARVAADGQAVDGRAGFRLMDWRQAGELVADGHEVGAHSRWHPLLPELDDAMLREEVRAPHETIAEKLQTPPRGFCYPNGDHDRRVVDAVREAGYTYACTTAPGLNGAGTDVFRLRRIDVTRQHTVNRRGRSDLLGFRAEISGMRAALRKPA